jgi:hypothetical protein
MADGGEAMIVRAGRWAHLGFAWLFVAGVLLQAYLAGAALAQLGGSGDFGTHISVGYTVMGLLALAVLISALVGRVPRRDVALSIALVILYIIQTALPSARAGAPLVAALHPANAMVLLILAAIIGWRARSLVAEARLR